MIAMSMDETPIKIIAERKGLNKPPKLVNSLSLARASFGTVLNTTSGIVRKEIITAIT